MANPPDTAHASLATLSSYDDPDAGIRERFDVVVARDGETPVIVTEPLGDHRAGAWAICPSFAAEAQHLAALEARVARDLAAAGFETVRFDHLEWAGPTGQVRFSVDRHLRRTVDAIDDLRRRIDGPVALAGARFGGLVAAVLARRLDLPFLAMWQPSESGEAFLATLAHGHAAFELRAGTRRKARSAAEVLAGIAPRGVTELRGFGIERKEIDALRRLDLATELGGYRGRAVTIRVTDDPDSPAGPALTQVRTVVDPRARDLGRHLYLGPADRTVDVQWQLREVIANETVAWASPNVR